MTFIMEKCMLFVSQRGIDSIFKKDPEGGYYNKKARLLQDILIFGSTIEENESFKSWDLAKYLLEKMKNLEIIIVGRRLNMQIE